MGLTGETEYHQNWRLNERHYGTLQGRDKKACTEIHGKAAVAEWRTSFNAPPPSIDFNHEDHPRFDQLYSHLSFREHLELPVGESLEMVTERAEKYWKSAILPSLEQAGEGKCVLVSSHKHLLRGMVHLLAGLTPEQVSMLSIHNGQPFVFEVDRNNDYEVVKNYYIEDESEEVVAAVKEDDVELFRK